MREVKFRAWNTDYTTGPIMEYFTLREALSKNTPWHYSDKHIMQYTGLKDTAGREIYEDDVYVDSIGYLYQVIFEEGCFALLCIPDLFGHKETLPITNIIHADLQHFGNAHENPDVFNVSMCMYKEECSR